MEAYTTGTGQELTVHDRAVCSALRRPDSTRFCVIHRRKDTHMKGWPTNWRDDWGGFMEVMCRHGIGHPAPEERRTDISTHTCDGCCSPQARTADGDQTPYRIGGLMRCCILTLSEADVFWCHEGQELPCRWCSSKMVFRQGAWEWDRSRAPIHGFVIPAEAELA